MKINATGTLNRLVVPQLVTNAESYSISNVLIVSREYQLPTQNENGRTGCPTVVWHCVAICTRTDVPNDTLYSQDTKFKINPLTQPKSDSKQRLSTAQAR